MKTKIIQITAGKGPAECSWVVAKVLKSLLKELVIQKLNYTILQQEKGEENGTVQSVTIQLSGDDKLMAKFLKEWTGTVQWIGQSTFRKYNKRKNWFVGIFEIEQKQAIDLQSHEVKYQAIRSSGPGGQHVNKVCSAIRAIHEPTTFAIESGKKKLRRIQIIDQRSMGESSGIGKREPSKSIYRNRF